MTDILKEIFEKFKGVFIWWVVIMPWEEALIIRNGKRIRHKEKGVHFKIPYLDRVFIKCVRVQVVQSAPQTITTNEGKNKTICVAIDYFIDDLNKLYNEALEPEQMLVSTLNGIVSDQIKNSGKLSTDDVLIKMNENNFGLKVTKVNTITNVDTRTYRLIQDSHFIQDGEKLNVFDQ
tara:strand:+ start:301 stop:831 length:531 start_codon:yes stop_codon:yes gene_type:complete